MTWRSVKDDPPPNGKVFLVSDGENVAAAMVIDQTPSLGSIMFITGEMEDGYMGAVTASLDCRMTWERQWTHWSPIPDPPEADK